VLAIPAKRDERRLLTWLTDDELEALLAAPNRATWTGRRDHAMLLLATQTGLRISELIGLSCGDVTLGTGAHVHCLGKGRKERATPLTALTAEVLRGWLTERAGTRVTRSSHSDRSPAQPRRHRAPPGPPSRDRPPHLPVAAR
jgi:site-specific recombinase XerD